MTTEDEKTVEKIMREYGTELLQVDCRECGKNNCYKTGHAREYGFRMSDIEKMIRESIAKGRELEREALFGKADNEELRKKKGLLNAGVLQQIKIKCYDDGRKDAFDAAISIGRELLESGEFYDVIWNVFWQKLHEMKRGDKK